MLPFVPSSFGDIIAAANIAHSIYKALSDSTGSSFEYQCLIDELRSFEDALLLVHRAIKDSLVSESDRRNIEAETAKCLELLTTFWGRIENYQVVLSKRWRGVWRKITWAIWKAEEVEGFRQKLSQHKQNIMVFLIAQQLIMTSQDKASVRLKMDEMLKLQRRPSPPVGYDLDNALVLTDALGERLTLPMQFCFSPDELHDTLMRLFKGKNGQSHVERGCYRISTEDGKSTVRSDEWGTVVKKGAVLVMSMVVMKVALKQGRARHQRKICPHCYETDVGVMPDDGWLQWHV